MLTVNFVFPVDRSQEHTEATSTLDIYLIPLGTYLVPSMSLSDSGHAFETSFDRFLLGDAMHSMNSRRTWLRSTTALVTASAAAAAMMTPSGVAFAQDEEVDDEIIVTGSYIRRGNFDTPTPLNIVDQADILEMGSPNITDVIRNQTFNSGTAFQGNRANNTNQNGAFAEANLRGLGSGATLTLMNGKRSGTEQFEQMYPLIAVQRIETLLDGASALYGSDAVAGVVNLIPFTDYEGMKVQMQGTWEDDFGGHDVYDISLMFGAGNDTTHIVAAFNWFDRSALLFNDRPRLSNVSFGFSGNANPGNFDVVERDEFGDPTGRLDRQIDPECGNPNVPAQGPTEFDEFGHPAQNVDADGFSELRSQPAGFLAFSTCRFNFETPYNFIPDTERLQSYISVTHDITDDLTFHAEGVYARVDSHQAGSLTDPGVLNFPTLGTNPGNPFRAAASGGELLFAQDDWNNDNPLDMTPDGIPDRDPDVNVTQLGLGDVILASNRFASIEDDEEDGGIPFYEDFKGTGVRTIGNLGPWPSFGVNSNGGTFQGTTSNRMRVLAELTWEIPNSNWFANVSYLMDRFDWTSIGGDVSRSRVIDALNCEGGPDGDACFNPFGNHAISDANLQNLTVRSSSAVIEAPAASFEDRAHTQEMVDWIFLHATTDRNEAVLNVVDFVTGGDLFNASWAGDRSVGMAIGGQFRREREDNNDSTSSNKNDNLFFGFDGDVRTERDVFAVFGELAVPIFDTDELGTMDLQAALRYEDFGGGLNTWDPKLAVIWQPRDNISIRGSWGTSFVAPSVRQTTIRQVGLQNIPDQVFDGAGAAGGFLQTPIAPNANLSPETSDNWNVGFSWEVIDDLTISADYFSFKFTNRIVTIGARDILDPDEVNFIAAGGTFGNADDALSWTNGVNIGASTLDFGVATADPRINRDTLSGSVLSIDRNVQNADFFNTAGVDASVRYRFNPADWSDSIGDIGTFNWSTSATWVTKFDYSAGGNLFDGIGYQNGHTNVATPIPEWRVNSTLAWSYEDAHAASVTARWTSTVKTASSAVQRAGGCSAAVFAGFGTGIVEEAAVNPDYACNITDQVTFDVQYTYRFGGWMFDDDRETTITVGSINVLDNKPPKIADFGGTDTFLADVRGRMLYLRLGQEL